MIDTGLHEKIPSEIYHRRQLGVVSKSALDLIHRSPAHYKAWADGATVEEPTPALFFGNAFHCAVLEPEKFARRYTVEPDFGDCRFKKNKQERDSWRAENAGLELLTEQDMATIHGMMNSVHSHPLASKMIRDGKSELTISWEDRETGLRCKSRADYYVERLGMVADVKSTADASWAHFRRDIVKYRYHVQDALYRHGFEEVGAAVQHFVFIAVEKMLPFAVAVYSLDADGIGKGYSQARGDIDTMAECMKTDNWPGYPMKIQTIDLPPWAE